MTTLLPHDAGLVDAVVIGASAGGIDALLSLLPALPAGRGPAVFVVMHLPRERPSRLVALFGPHCAAPVREAQDKEPVEAGCVYFAPPDYHLLLDAGPQLALSDDELVNWSRPSIDVLFESAADVYGPRLLGVVLTGANGDGAAGAAEIRRRGGWVAVQDPRSAQSPFMPAAVIERGAADFVGGLPQLADLLRSLTTAPPRAEG